MRESLIWAPACAGAPPRSGDREGGFTLIEMLVALAVFSLAALALLRLESTTLANTATLESRAFGQLVARNVSVETLVDPTPPTLGATRGQETNGGRVWSWTRVTRRTADARLLRIDIAVTDASGERAGSLTIVRPVDYPPEGLPPVGSPAS